MSARFSASPHGCGRRRPVSSEISPAVALTEILAQGSEEHKQYMLSKIPMGRFLEVDEIAAMVAWLSSEECSFTTGAVFDLTGGRATY